MCTQPLHIQNPRYSFLKHPPFMDVPCGFCDECLDKLAKDLYVRAREEYNGCLDSGGCGFMCCLTYTDKQLPYFSFDGKKFMVFDKQAIIDFIKRLRTNLDRYYQKHYSVDAPDFKYMVTSEFGSDPNGTHRPHYHLLFFFEKFISHFAFHYCFVLSMTDRRRKNRLFGFRYQCDPIDPSKGGIKYSAKYVCKDIMYEPQRKAIKDLLLFNKLKVESEFGIIDVPQNEHDILINKCIRSRKDYKKAIAERVRPYRHMLQFYMVSNDFGISKLINKYGKDNLISLPLVNYNGFPYSLPRLVKTRIERDYGEKSLNKLQKNIFSRFLHRCLSDLQLNNVISSDMRQDLCVFADAYVQPSHGQLKIVLPDFEKRYNVSNNLRDWDDIINEFKFFEDNDFFLMLRMIKECLKKYSCKTNMDIRANIALNKRLKQEHDYIVRKRNKALVP